MVASMGEHKRPIYCPWCRSHHGRRFLCDPAAAVLAASAERGNSGTLPTIEMDAPLPMTPDPRADLIVAQLVVKAGVLTGPGGVVHPVLVLTGMDAQRRILPSWFYCADDVKKRRTLVAETDLAREKEALLRLASEQEPIEAWKLWQRASRDTCTMTPFTIAAMWELIGDGLLDYNSSAVVTVVDQRTRRIEDLIEASSLGTPEAKALRAATPREVARRVVDRSHEIADGDTC